MGREKDRNHYNTLYYHVTKVLCYSIEQTSSKTNEGNIQLNILLFNEQIHGIEIDIHSQEIV